MCAIDIKSASLGTTLHFRSSIIRLESWCQRQFEILSCPNPSIYATSTGGPMRVFCFATREKGLGSPQTRGSQAAGRCAQQHRLGRVCDPMMILRR